jgi:hypothetical protein
MILDNLIDPPNEDPSPSDIRRALKQVYEGKLEAVVLSAEKESHRFLQTPRGGGHLEARTGRGKPLLSAERVPLAQAVEIFLDFAREGNAWRSAVDWVPVSRPTHGRAHKPGRPIWKILLVVLGGLLAVGLFCWLTQTQPLAQVLYPAFYGGGALLYWLLLWSKERAGVDLAPPLWRSGAAVLLWLGISALALVISIEISGLWNLSTAAVLAVDAWMVWSAARRTLNSLEFQRLAEEVEANRVRLVMVDRGFENAPQPEFAYQYLGEHRAQRAVPGLQLRWQKLSRALDSGRLRLYVRYHPEDPAVHRISRLEVED